MSVPARHSLVLLALVGVTGCGFEAGSAWGVVTPDLSVRLAPVPARLENGRIRTSNDYRVAVEAVSVVVGELRLTLAAEGALSFDPSAPPPGYSLCHNGHCHSDDGRLVDYADVAAEQAGGATSDLLALRGPEAALALGLGDVGVAVALAGCESAGCEIAQPSSSSGVVVTLSQMTVSGRVYDARSGDDARLSLAGLGFTVAVQDLVITSAFAAAFGPEERLGLDLEVVVELPETLFDGIEWADPDAVLGASDSVGNRLAEDAALAIRATRFD